MFPDVSMKPHKLGKLVFNGTMGAEMLGLTPHLLGPCFDNHFWISQVYKNLEEVSPPNSMLLMWTDL